ncbi:MAG: glycoside hydrolase family 13 protein [Chloroflexota bacterium]
MLVHRPIGNFLFMIVMLILASLIPAGRLLSAAPHASADCNIWWNEVLHDTFNSDYRSVVGPTTPGGAVKLRLRVAQSDITSARVRVWDDRANTQTYYSMAWDGAFDNDPVTYDWWYSDIPVGSQPTILYYFFEINDSGGGSCTADQDFYVDDDVKFYGGGSGAMSDGYDDTRSFQITVYDPAFSVPSWMQRGVVYQVFPDRFRDGNSGNNPPAGRFFYNTAAGTIVRSNQSDWNTTICDPRSTYTPSCAGQYSENFYGGDLQGITDKINQGYFDSLGVTVLYLNPIFYSPSNHKYDTADYLVVDSNFGTLAEFQNLVSAADGRGMEVILDGVFNHTSSDSPYFDYYSRYDAAGNLTSPNGPGANDGSGACEATTSSYRAWFYFSDVDTIYNPGRNADNSLALCADNPPGRTYEAWYGYGSLPKLKANTTPVRALIWSNGLNSAGPYWVSQGAGGWRFDVGGDVDPGLTNDPANDYWEGFRAAVRDSGVTGRSDTLLLGEEWGDGSPWLLGNEWDSVMNYRFRSAVLGWLFTGCSGNGCTGGTVFEDNDSNSSSASGSISQLSPSQLNARLRSIWEDYPPMAFKAMMNLEGSHDTNRLRFLLRKINNDNDGAAVQRMKEWWLFSFTFAGAPTLYYGDEVGLNHDGVWANSKWEDDPYNRAPFPWSDASGSSYTADTTNLLPHARRMASIRQSYRALQDGDVQFGMIINDAQKLYGFGRTNGTQTALIALNRDNAAHTATFSGLNAAPYNLPNGTVMVDALNGGTFTVSGGQLSLTVNSNWGVVLLEQAKVETPAVPSDLNPTPADPDVTLTWTAVRTDTAGGVEVVTSYTVHRSTNPTFTPDATNLIATVTPLAFGSVNAAVTYSDPGGYGDQNTYAVCAVNAAGKQSCTAPTPVKAILYTSSTTSGAAGGVSFADEDILSHNTSTGVWAMVFDGSDVGLGSTDVDALEFLDDGSILLSLDSASFNIPGLGTVDDSDIVKFIPTSLGSTTAGTWEMYFDGSDVGLTTDSEDVDAIGFTPAGKLVVSTLGSFTVTGASGADEDMVEFTATSTGWTTSGTWALYFDGSDVGLTATTEDIWGTWLDSATSQIYLSVSGAFSVTGASGDGADVFICAPGSLGSTTTCTFGPGLYWDGSANGYAGEVLDDIAIVR